MRFEQEVGDDLSIYVLNLLPKVNNLPSLLARGLVKEEIQNFEIIMWFHATHVITR